jgi:lysophospholipase L1-like esterase
VLVGFVVVWVLVDRTVGVAADPWPDAAGRILALGDSYISGEGAPEYFEGTNVVGGDDPNQCRRAPSAYPSLVADRLGMGLDFLACSGAHTEQVDGGTDAGPAGPVAGHDDQLAHLSATRTPAQIEAIDVVLVSVGGNDVGFGTIVKACLLPASCDVLEQIWLANIETLGEELPATYQAIKEALPDTPIVVVPYPLILDEQTCGLAIDASEHAFVARFILALNAEVEAAASEAGVHVYPDAASAFEGHLLCDPDPATNFFQLSPTAGDFALRVLPSNWIHGSMHPGSSGHELLAAGLEPYIDDLLRRVAAGDPPNPVPVPGQDDAMSGEEAAEAEEAEELLSSDEWIQDQLYQTVGALVLPVGLLLMGGWVAAAGTVKQSWRLARFLSPPGSDTDQSNEGSETSETA